MICESQFALWWMRFHASRFWIFEKRNVLSFSNSNSIPGPHHLICRGHESYKCAHSIFDKTTMTKFQKDCEFRVYLNKKRLQKLFSAESRHHISAPNVFLLQNIPIIQRIDASVFFNLNMTFVRILWRGVKRLFVGQCVSSGRPWANMPWEPIYRETARELCSFGYPLSRPTTIQDKLASFKAGLVRNFNPVSISVVQSY